jgi:hypothetical protein
MPSNSWRQWGDVWWSLIFFLAVPGFLLLTEWLKPPSGEQISSLRDLQEKGRTATTVLSLVPHLSHHGKEVAKFQVDGSEYTALPDWPPPDGIGKPNFVNPPQAKVLVLYLPSDPNVNHAVWRRSNATDAESLEELRQSLESEVSAYRSKQQASMAQTRFIAVGIAAFGLLLTGTFVLRKIALGKRARESK